MRQVGTKISEWQVNMCKVKRRMDTPKNRAFWKALDNSIKGVENWEEFKNKNSWLYKNYSSGDYK